MQVKTSFYPFYIIFQDCRDCDVIQIEKQEVFLLLRYIRKCMGHLWNAAVALHSPKSILFNWSSPSSLAKPAFFGHVYWEHRAEIQLREEFCVPSILAENRVRILYRYCNQLAVVASFWVAPFFLNMTTPQAHGDYFGSIITYSINISISFLHASFS